MVVDEIRRIILDIPHQIGQSHRRFQPDKHMHMIFNAVHDNRFLPLVPDDTCHVFENFLPPIFLQEVLASLHGENDLDINLGKRACHGSSNCNG
jgi:hypothetical protein